MGSEVRRGRPSKEENREKLSTCSVKLTRDERDMLETLRYSTGRSRSDIFRDALRKVYETYKEERRDEYVDHDFFDDYYEDFE